ncbi:MAG: ThiF family adenylyltransferase [Candidatus ainarchaeum sp.]|nr:ThiF family adenylyltransferase [Candidatus ainarchaeum sp.]
MVDGIFLRNAGTVSEREQKKLAESTVGIVGLGGIGSPAFEILVRLGIGNFVIFDRDRFEESNFNRQLYAVDSNVGKFKAGVAAAKARKINPEVRVEAYAEEFNKKNAAKLRKCDVMVDGTDNMEARKNIAAFCRKMKIPYVFCSAGKSMGMVSVFDRARFKDVFGEAREGVKKSVIAPAAVLAGSISASQAACVLLGKPYVRAPEFIFFDIFSERFLWKQKV